MPDAPWLPAAFPTALHPEAERLAARLTPARLERQGSFEVSVGGERIVVQLAGEYVAEMIEDILASGPDHPVYAAFRATRATPTTRGAG